MQSQQFVHLQQFGGLTNNYLGNMLGGGGGGGMLPSYSAQQAAALGQMQQMEVQYSAFQQALDAQLATMADTVCVAPARDTSYAKRRAQGYVEEGDKLIDRIAFWSAFGWVARWIVGKLADRLEYITDEMSRWHEMAQEA